MNSDDLDMELGLNAKDVEVGMQAIAAACNVGSLALKDFSVKLEGSNSAGKTVELTLRELPPGIEKVTATLRDNGTGWELVGHQIKHTVDVVKDASSVIETAADAIAIKFDLLGLKAKQMAASSADAIAALLKANAALDKGSGSQLPRISAADLSSTARAMDDLARATSALAVGEGARKNLGSAAESTFGGRTASVPNASASDFAMSYSGQAAYEKSVAAGEAADAKLGASGFAAAEKRAAAAEAAANAEITAKEKFLVFAKASDLAMVRSGEAAYGKSVAAGEAADAKLIAAADVMRADLVRAKEAAKVAFDDMAASGFASASKRASAATVAANAEITAKEKFLAFAKASDLAMAYSGQVAYAKNVKDSKDAVDRQIAEVRRLMAAKARDQDEATYLNNIPGKAGRKLRGQAPTAGDTISDALSSRFFGANLASMALTRGISLLTREFKESIAAGLEYERGLTQIQVVTGLTTAQTSLFGEKLLTLSGNFGLKSADLQSAALEVFKNKAVGAADAMGLLNSASLLAKATGQNAADAAKAIDTQLQIFNLDASHHLQVAQLLEQAWKADGGSLVELNSSMAKMEIILEPMGVKMGEQVNMLTAFSKTGLNTQAAVDRITQAFIRMNLALESDPTLQIKLRAQNMQQLVENTGSATAAIEAFMAANARGGSNIGTSALGYAGYASLVKVLPLIKEMGDAHATLDKDAATAMDSVNGRWEKFAAKMAAAKTKLGEFFVELALHVADAATPNLGGKLEARKLTPEQAAATALIKDATFGLSGAANDPRRGFWEKELEEGKKALAEATANQEKALAEATKAEEEITQAGNVEQKKRFQAAAENFAAIRGRYIEENAKMDRVDKERSENTKIELDVQLKRFEDSVRTETELATKAKAQIKTSEDNLEGAKDSFAAGRFNRQLSITKDPRAQARLIAERTQKIEGEATKLVTHFGTLEGDKAVNSKDIENARAKMSEAEQRAQENFNKLAAGGGTKQQLLAAESAIVAVAEKRKTLEEQILKVSQAQEASAKAKSDALKIQFDIAQQATREALEVKVKDKDETRDKGQVLAEFNEKSDRALKAMAKAGLSPDAQQAATFQFDSARKQLEGKFDREAGLKGANAQASELNKMFTSEVFAVRDQAVKLEEALAIATDALLGTARKLAPAGPKTTDEEARNQFLKQAGIGPGFNRLSQFATGPAVGKTTDEEARRQFANHAALGAVRAGGVDFTKSTDEDVANQLPDRRGSTRRQPSFLNQATDWLKQVQAPINGGSVNTPGTHGSTTNDNNVTINVNGVNQKPEELAHNILRLVRQGLLNLNLAN